MAFKFPIRGCIQCPNYYLLLVTSEHITSIHCGTLVLSMPWSCCPFVVHTPFVFTQSKFASLLQMFSRFIMVVYLLIFPKNGCALEVGLGVLQR